MKKTKKNSGDSMDSLRDVKFAKRVGKHLVIRVNAIFYTIAMMDVLGNQEIHDTFNSVMADFGGNCKRYYGDALFTILAIGCDNARLILEQFEDKEFSSLIDKAQVIEDKMNQVFNDYDELHNVAMIHMQLSGHSVYTFYDL